MNINPGNPDTDAQRWVKKQLSKGVYELVDLSVFDQALVEATPVWVLPNSLLIGKIRNKGYESSTRWFICGDCETLHTPEEVANSPQEALRHFSLMWQAKLGKDISPDNAEQKVALEKAESLYELSQQDSLWGHDN